MAFTASDVVPLTQARATLSDLVEQVKAGAEKNHLLLIDDAAKGLDDIAAGKVKDAHTTLAALKRRRSAKTQA